MEFCYGNMNHVRILEEAKFWKRQETEHTVVIREIVPNLENEFVRQLEEYQRIFGAMEATLVQCFEQLNRSCYKITPAAVRNIVTLIEKTVCQSEAWIKFLKDMLKNSIAVRTDQVAVTVINHIMRESEYYIGIAKTYLRTVKRC